MRMNRNFVRTIALAKKKLPSHLKAMEEFRKFPMHEAARDGRTQIVESLLKESPELASRIDDDGRLAIHWAVSFGHKDIVRLLAANEKFDPNVQDGSGWTPLMIAVSLKDGEELVDLLLRKGADVNAKSMSLNLSQFQKSLLSTQKILLVKLTALHFIASKKNIQLARNLMSHDIPARTRICDKRRQYPIHRAAAVGSVPLVELLIKHKSPINAADIFGQTPLHHAIAEGHGDTAVSLLKAGVDTKIRDSDDKLAIQLAPNSQIRNFIIREAELEGIEL
ncbi:Ankyrin repeat-containing protein C6C3.08 [Golovinomyces cichoracearum]|uniref:Ankyrin repeat-containing protein C6C3.08 n=1 Tax=Golovinomyces cichoracearum TaxID=62708 RepID=A0A420HBQ4_9PEZI|nr:Ankyrin repeat-containing protein C6C3.08 [Golovinomyces cichoracearum]